MPLWLETCLGSLLRTEFMKQKLSWHIEILNRLKEFDRKRQMEINRDQINLDQTKMRIAFLEKQLTAAINKNMDGFDEDKFMKPKTTKQPTDWAKSFS